MSMAITMMGNGLMIRLRGLEFLYMQMERVMRGSGSMIFSMEKGSKSGLMVGILMGTMRWGRRKGTASLCGLMGQFLLGRLRIIILRGMANSLGPMEGNTRESGKII